MIEARMEDVAVDRLYDFVKRFVSEAIDEKIEKDCSQGLIPEWIDMLLADNDGGTTFEDTVTGMQIDINFDVYDCSEER